MSGAVMFTDLEFVVRRKDAIRGSQRLRNAIFKTMGYKLPSRRGRPCKPVAPSFLAPPKRSGRPKGSFVGKDKAEEVRQVQICVAKSCKVRLENLRARNKQFRYCRARQIAMYVAKKTINISYAELGRQFKRDHATVMHGIRVIQGLIDSGDVTTIRALQRVHDRLSTPNPQSAYTADSVMGAAFENDRIAA